MRLTVLVYASPYTYQAGYTAYRFVQAALARGHTIPQIFFYLDGVYHASELACASSDEFDLFQAWRDLGTQHAIPLRVCITAALHRGLLSQDEALSHGKSHYNLSEPFELAGLGQFMNVLASSERLLTFGR